VRDAELRRTAARLIALVFVVYVAVAASIVAGVAWLTSDWVQGAWYEATGGWALRVVAVIVGVLSAPVLVGAATGVVVPLAAPRFFLRAREVSGGRVLPESQGPTPLGAVAIEVRKLARYALSVALALPLHLVPGVGSLAFVGVVGVVTAWFVGWEIFAWHFELTGLDLAAQRAWLRSRWPTVLAVGGLAALTTLVPVLQLFFSVAHVAGAGALSARLRMGDVMEASTAAMYTAPGS
jgi:CysZ protein